MNPSFSVSFIASWLRDSEYRNIDPATFFKWSYISSNHDLIDCCIDYENYAYGNHPYFNRPREIANKVGLDWQHVDLFLYKATNQETFTSRITEKGEQFARDQIELFGQVITKIAPCCLAVINAGASEKLQGYFKDELAWDDECGFHWFRNKIPIFFSSMLSGQRALDRESYERLKWHICLAVGKPR